MAAVEFLQTLLSVSEKAATIARVIRSDQRLFQMLIEEKTGDQKNTRFIQDFKTLADVLIQETIKHDIGKEYPSMVNNIKGEESNTFTNITGESICVQVKVSEQETCDLLAKVLAGDSIAAGLLAHTVHSSIKLNMLSQEQMKELSSVSFSADELGIWIDPIDGTSEYINGRQDASTSNEIYPCGLQCCTVLIGAYILKTGEPVLGIVNQPFNEYQPDSNTWIGKAYWGFSSPERRFSSIELPKCNPSKNVVVVSASESEIIKERLTECGYVVVHGAGAGYKLLCVALGAADIYILSQGTTFKWDTCGPHSLLHAMGGSIVDFQQAVSDGANVHLSYHTPNEGVVGLQCWANQGGMIAYTNESAFNNFIGILKNV